jgi:hypothetical protein
MPRMSAACVLCVCLCVCVCRLKIGLKSSYLLPPLLLECVRLKRLSPPPLVLVLCVLINKKTSEETPLWVQRETGLGFRV